MKYFDAHTHTNFVAYDADRNEVMVRAKEAGVGMNIVGTQLDTSKAAVEMAEKYGGDVYATIGLHPVHTSKSYHDTKELGEGGKEFTSRGEVFDFAAYEALAASPRVIAVGEVGLDYYRNDESTKQMQKEIFVQQIELANKIGKPLMLHIRATQGTMNAYEDALELVKSHAKVSGDVHFFAGDWNIARQFLDIGFTLSFTGVLTFTHDYDEVVRNTPLDSILSETDAPYITPVPHRGKRNEPVYVVEVVKAIARIKGAGEEEIAHHIRANVRRMYAI